MTSPAATARVCTVILNWNQPAMTVDCARAALAQEVLGGQTVLVIDNGSAPHNREALRAALPPGCEFVQNDRNLGFAGGMNVGIRHALRRGYDYVWLLNNDAFPREKCLSLLVSALAADPQLACVTPALFGADGREQYAGAALDWQPLRNEMLLANECREPRGAGHWLTGTALLFARAPLAATGGFDERFFAYWEEVDLCYRAASLGYRYRAVPEAACLHLGSVSTGGGGSSFSVHMMARNAWLFLRKHVPVWRVPATGLSLLASQVVRAGRLLVREKRGEALSLLGGAAAGLTGRAGRAGPLVAQAAWADVVLARFWGIARLMDGVGRMIPTRCGP